MKKKYKKCSQCHKKKSTVKRRKDPYEQEINNKIIKRGLCIDCYNILSEEI